MQKRKSFGNNRPCDICLILFHLFRCLISIFVIVHEYPRGLKMTIVEGKWIKIVIPENKSITSGSIGEDTNIVKHFYHHGYKFKSHDQIIHIIPICGSFLWSQTSFYVKNVYELPFFRFPSKTSPFLCSGKN